MEIETKRKAKREKHSIKHSLNWRRLSYWVAIFIKSYFKHIFFSIFFMTVFIIVQDLRIIEASRSNEPCQMTMDCVKMISSLEKKNKLLYFKHSRFVHSWWSYPIHHFHSSRSLHWVDNCHLTHKVTTAIHSHPDWWDRMNRLSSVELTMQVGWLKEQGDLVGHPTWSCAAMMKLTSTCDDSEGLIN